MFGQPKTKVHYYRQNDDGEWEEYKVGFWARLLPALGWALFWGGGLAVSVWIWPLHDPLNTPFEVGQLAAIAAGFGYYQGRWRNN